MANNFYYIEDLVSNGSSTVTLVDDGVGIDWMILREAHTGQSIDLGWSIFNGVTLQSSGIYYVGNTGNRLVVVGQIENARGSSGADWIDGSELNNRILGEGGNDTLNGDAGNDVIYGGTGADSMSGSYGADRLFGEGGNDTISGGDDSDTISGGAGADSLSGGANLTDWVSYAGSDAAVNVTFTFGTTTTGRGGHAAGDQLNGFNNILGSDFGDQLRDSVEGAVGGNYNANIFDGAGGNDDLFMGGANDTAYGGMGFDYIAGQNGNDRLFGGGNGDRIYGGAGADFMVGGEGNDMLFANEDNDRLFGGVGDDVLHGAAGRDRLQGDAGADRFIFLKADESTVLSTGRDVIVDFNRAEGDRIGLAQIDANGAADGFGSFTFVTVFTGQAGQLRVADTADGQRVLADLNGDRISDFAIDVLGNGRPMLIESDFNL